MGAFFIGGQALEYAALVHEGITIPASAYGSVFYLTTGFHGLHVTGGLIAFLLRARPHLHGQAVHPRAGGQRHRRVLLLALRRRRLDRPVRDDLPDPVAAPAPGHDPGQNKGHPVRLLSARLSSKRRSPFAGLVVLVMGLLITGGLYAAVFSPAQAQQSASPSADQAANRATTSTWARPKCLPYLLPLSFDGLKLSTALNQLKGWDSQMTIDYSRPPFIWPSSTACSDTFDDQVPQDYWQHGDDNGWLAIRALAEEADSPWWDNTQTPAVETRDDILRQAFSDGYADRRSAWAATSASAEYWGRTAHRYLYQPDPGRIGRVGH